MKPGTKLGQILSSHKNKIQSNKRQSAIYPIPCKDCNMVYIGETKRSFEPRKKEHIRDIRNAQSKPANIKDSTTALGKHAINLHHNIGWNNNQILEFETDYRKRRFIESFFINNVPNTMNDGKSISLPSMYFKLEK